MAATAEAAPAAARRSPKAASILGEGLVYEGRILGDGELHVEGTVRGQIEVARLVIGEGAVVEGSVRCAVVEIRGRLVGDVQAKSVKLFETARVEGDITHEQLAIEVGAQFQGRCQPFTAADRTNVVELGAG